MDNTNNPGGDDQIKNQSANDQINNGDNKPNGGFTDGDKVNNKSVEEIAKMYAEASKKLGEQGQEIGQYKNFIEKTNILLSAISKDPEREKMVKEWVKSLEEKAEDNESDNKKTDNSELLGVKRETHENRQVLEQNVVSDFSRKYGIDKLDSDKKKEVNLKIGQALWEIVDPAGKFENYQDMVDSIPLSKLPRVLDNAYFLANRDAIEKGDFKVPNFTGAIGQMGGQSIDASSADVTLSADEKKAAVGLGITEEEYIKRKKDILSEK